MSNGAADHDSALIRYQRDGSVDSSFGNAGNAGKVTTDFEASLDWAYALALQPDGGIVAVGQIETDFAVARFGG